MLVDLHRLVSSNELIIALIPHFVKALKYFRQFDRNVEIKRNNLGRFYLFLQADIFSEKAQQGVATENPSEISFAVTFCQLLHTEVGGDDGGTTV